MKKLLLTVAALLQGLLAFSQEAEVTVVPRLEGQFAPSEKATFANSGLYTEVSANFTDNLSFYTVNHWVADGVDWIYRGLGYSNTTNWLDYLYLQYDWNRWSFLLGKDMLFVGAFEADANDYERHLIMDSQVNNWFCCYQWGAKVSYTTKSEKTSISAQFATSPYGERPFASGLFCYGLETRGQYGIVSDIVKLSAVQTAPKNFIWIVSAGAEVELGKFTVGADYMNTMGLYEDRYDTYYELAPGHTLLANVKWNPSDKFQFQLKGGMELLTLPGKAAESYWYGGLACHYFPVDNLRLHFVTAGGAFRNTVSFNLGVTYFLTFPGKK